MSANSTDGARTFTLAEGTTPTDWLSAGDVPTTFDNKGNAYLSYLVLDRLGTPSYWARGAGRNGIYVRRSADGGKTFRPSHQILQTGPVYFGPVPGVSRVMGFPQIGIEPKSGTLHVAYFDYTHGDIDIFAATARDHGRTWSKPLRVNDDPLHNGKDQFFQWLAVDPVRGDVYIQFDDRRAGKTGFTLARSNDGGGSYTNYRWSETPFESDNAFLSDYTWLTAYDRKVYGTWTEPGGVKVGTANFQ